MIYKLKKNKYQLNNRIGTSDRQGAFQEETPGPGAYEDKQNSVDLTYWVFFSFLEDKHLKIIIPSKKIKKRKPKHVIAAKFNKEKIELGPGPSSYEPKDKPITIPPAYRYNKKIDKLNHFWIGF